MTLWSASQAQHSRFTSSGKMPQAHPRIPEAGEHPSAQPPQGGSKQRLEAGPPPLLWPENDAPNLHGTPPQPTAQAVVGRTIPW